MSCHTTIFSYQTANCGPASQHTIITDAETEEEEEETDRVVDSPHQNAEKRLVCTKQTQLGPHGLDMFRLLFRRHRTTISLTDPYR